MKSPIEKKKNRTLPGMALGVALGLAAPICGEAAAIRTMISNNFDGSPATGPAFQRVDNGQGGGGTINLNTGMISTAAHNNSATGIKNVARVDVTSVTGATGFRIEWVVSAATITRTDATSVSGSPRANGWFFGVTDSLATDGPGLFNNADNTIGVTLISGNHQTMGLFERAGVTMVTTSLGVDTPTLASFNDGFTVSLTFHADQSWSLTTTGLSKDINHTGTAAHVSYANLAANLVAVTSVQGNAVSYTVDSVTLSAISGPSTPLFGLTITAATAPATGFDLEWESQPGKLYNLRTSTDLSGEISTWDILESEVVATPPFNNSNIDLADARRFFAVEEFDAPPPPPLFSWDFEDDNGGFTPIGTPNDWAWGTPNSNNNFNLTLTTGNDGSTGAWATNLGSGDSPSGLINPAADSILRSPDIDLSGITGAQLSFAAAYDAAPGDVIEVIVREVGTDVQLGPTISPINTAVGANSGWTTLGPFDLSAGDDKEIYIEFRFAGTSNVYIGFYLDDVKVTQN